MDEKKGRQWYWQCRLWWPQHLIAAHPEQAMALLGWASLSSASSSLDLVIAAACPFPSSGSFQVFFFFSPDSFSCTLCCISGLGKKHCEEMNGQKLVFGEMICLSLYL
jgi:hypothetical protein